MVPAPPPVSLHNGLSGQQNTVGHPLSTPNSLGSQLLWT
jgi:hypothetical protein